MNEHPGPRAPVDVADYETLAPGDRLGDRYTIARVLGAGATAVTYLAHDEVDDRPVALKALRARALRDWKQLELFEREAKVLGGLRHHGVPEVYGFFERDGADGLELVLALEWIDGVSLADRITRGPRLDQVELVQLAQGLLDVLAYLHARTPPVFHRDIKPSNIIVRADGTPVLLDFGGVCDGWRPPSERGDTIVGTVGYMPPEQYMGQVGPWSDLYALGATLLHVILGRAPAELDFGAGRIALPADADVAPRLRRFVDALLAPAPRDRPESVQAARRLLFEDAAPAPATVAPTPPIAAAPPARALTPLGAAPRDIEGELAALYLRMRGHYSAPAGCVVHLAMLVAAIAVPLATDSLGALVGILLLWGIAWAALSQYNTIVDARLAPDATPGGHLFVHGGYAVAEIVKRTEHKTDTGNHVTLDYAYEVDGATHNGSFDASVMTGLSNPPGTRAGVLYDPALPSRHELVVEDLDLPG